jgi:hypothetical protein
MLSVETERRGGGGWSAVHLEFTPAQGLSFEARGVLVTILAELNERDVTFDEVVAATGCQESPEMVAVCLDKIRRAGYLTDRIITHPETGWPAGILADPAAPWTPEPPQEEWDPSSPPAPRAAVPTCLYRHFDEDGKLLYVGITHNSRSREEDHERSALWYGLSRRRTEVWHPSRADAEAAEIQAIKKQQPLFNVDHNEGEQARRRVRTYLEGRGLGAVWELHSRKTGKLRRRLPAPKR